MAVIYNTQYVDEKYASIVEPNLYYDSVLQPGVTFTDKYTMGQAGGYFVHKLGAGSLLAPTTPAGDFSGVVTADSLIQIILNNAFRKEEKIYGVTAASVSYDKAEAEFQRILKEAGQGWQASGVACMAHEASEYGDTTAITDSNIKDSWIAMRKYLKDKKANPNFGLVSTDVYESYLKAVGDEYTPLRNEQIMANARGGLYFGMPIIECNLFNETAVTYYDYTGTLQSVNLSHIDVVMGDYEAMSILTNLTSMRIIDTEDFVGVKAQVEMNSGFRVTNADRIVIKTNTSTSI